MAFMRFLPFGKSSALNSEDKLDWRKDLTESAWVAGNEPDGTELYVARGHYEKGVQLGKASDKVQIPYGGVERRLDKDFEVLMGPRPGYCLQWVRWNFADGHHPPSKLGIIVAGYESNGTALYVARATIVVDDKSALVPGKGGAHLRGCRIPFRGGELTVGSADEYEVLAVMSESEAERNAALSATPDQPPRASSIQLSSAAARTPAELGAIVKGPFRRLSDEPVLFTFGVISDLHFGGTDTGADMVEQNRKRVRILLEGVPSDLAEEPDAPRPNFVLALGDLTDHGYVEKCPGTDMFEKLFPKVWGKHVNEWQQYEDTVVKPFESIGVPVFEICGNHDYPVDYSPASFMSRKSGFYRSVVGTPVAREIRRRHGADRVYDCRGVKADLKFWQRTTPHQGHSHIRSEFGYTLQMGDVVLFMISVYPDKAVTDEWIRPRLKELVAQSQRPLWFIYCMHYGMDDWALGSWWSHDEANYFHGAIKDYKTVCIIHGHHHRFNYSQWKDIDIFNIQASYEHPEVLKVDVFPNSVELRQVYCDRGTVMLKSIPI